MRLTGMQLAEVVCTFS